MTDCSVEWSERVSAAAAAGTPLCLQGGGTKAFYGRPPTGERFDTCDHRGIVAYEPTELVMTVRAGTTLAEAAAVLAERGQMLAFEPPAFGDGATVGGCVAAGLSGPRRMAAGALRDYVLGVRLIDGRGQVLSFGGQVMKNVAGYDVSRLIAGSLGTLGLVLDVSLKVLPRPVREASVRMALDEAAALRRLNAWGGQPLPISASSWHEGELTLRLSGAEAAVEAAIARVGGDILAPAEASRYWDAVREHDHPFFAGCAGAGDADQMTLWRLGLPTNAPPLALPGRQLIEWGGGQRWLSGDAPAEQIRARAAELGGHATLFRGGAAARGGPVFQPLAPALMAIHRRLKHAFDPQGIFNPGRLYDGL